MGGSSSMTLFDYLCELYLRAGGDPAKVEQ